MTVRFYQQVRTTLGAGGPRYMVCDLASERPATDLHVGDRIWVAETGKLYHASSPTEWKEIGVPGGSVPTGTGWRHITAGEEDGAASTPSASDVNADPAGTGHTEAAAHVSDHESGYNHALLHSNALDHSNSLDHSNANDHAQAHNVTTHGDWPANASGYLNNNGSGTLTWGTPGGGATPAWKGAIAAAWKDGDPHWILDSMLHNPVHATPTNISITVARCAFFQLDTALTVNKIRWFGVGATTGLYHVAVYRVSDGVRMAILDDFNTAAQTWGSGAFSCTLAANVLYLLAVSVDTVGTTAGVACHSGTTGRIGIIPTNWPGNLDIDMASPKINAMGFCQMAVTTGALPASMPTLVLQAAWTGGMPAFFFDNNNA